METAAFGERLSKVVWLPQILYVPAHILLHTTPPPHLPCPNARVYVSSLRGICALKEDFITSATVEFLFLLDSWHHHSPKPRWSC